MFNYFFRKLFKCDYREFYMSGDKLGVRCANEEMHRKVKVERYGGVHDSYRITNTLVCLFCDCNKKKKEIQNNPVSTQAVFENEETTLETIEREIQENLEEAEREIQDDLALARSEDEEDEYF